jgi:hypothetical protein
MQADITAKCFLLGKNALRHGLLMISLATTLMGAVAFSIAFVDSRLQAALQSGVTSPLFAFCLFLGALLFALFLFQSEMTNRGGTSPQTAVFDDFTEACAFACLYATIGIEMVLEFTASRTVSPASFERIGSLFGWTGIIAFFICGFAGRKSRRMRKLAARKQGSSDNSLC